MPGRLISQDGSGPDAITGTARATTVRGTQSLVGQMGWVFTRPSLTLLEVAWRWLIGIPVLAACWIAVQRLLAELPLDATGVTDIDYGNPWVGAVRASHAWAQYRPHLAALLTTIGVPAALAWVAISAIGRNLVIKRMERGVRFRPLTMMALEAVWLAALAATLWGWSASLGWVAATHITPNTEPDLVGYAMWLIFLSLAFFTLWALVSWALTMAPLLALLEDRRSALSALGATLRLGKTFTGKLVEINLVMGIVKLALIVLAMVFSSVLLPFSDEVGMSALHLEWIVVLVFYCVAGDYFQVVRLKGFLEFWKIYRGPAGRG